MKRISTLLSAKALITRFYKAHAAGWLLLLLLLVANEAAAQTPTVVQACAGQSVTLSVPVDNSRAQWQVSTNGGSSYNNVGGVITTSGNVVTLTITATASNNGNYYRVRFTNPAGNNPSFSIVQQLIVNPIPGAPSAPAASRCGPGTVNIIASGAPAGGSYRWYASSTGGTALTNTSGTITSATFTTPSLTVGESRTYYVSAVSAAGECESTSRTAVTATANAIPVVTVNPTGSALTICSGGAVPLIASGAETYSWSPAAGLSATTGGTVVANPTQTTTYTVTGRAANGCTATAQVTVTVVPRPTASITTTTPTTFCAGGSVLLTAVADPATPAVGAYTYQWLDAGGNVVGTNPTFSATASGSYSVVITNTAGPCVSAPSDPVTVTANPIPAAPTNVSANTATFCGSGTPTLSATAGENGTTIRWYLVPSNGSPVSTGTSYTPAAAISATTTYYASSYNETTTCESSSRVAVTVTVNPVPVATITQGANASFCAGSSTTLTAQTAAGNSYIWYLDDVALTNQPNSNELVVSTAGSYTVQVTNNGCSSTSTATVVSEIPLPTAAIIPPAKTEYCADETVILNAQTGADYTYVWTRNGTAIPDQTSAELTVTQSGEYRVVVTANGCSAISDPVTITINPLPLATITAEGPLEFCEGGNVTLNAPAAPAGITYNYVWTRDGVVVQEGAGASYLATISGSYIVTVTTPQGCSNASPERTVIVGTQNEAAISYIGETEFCQGVGGAIDLIANEAPDGQPAYTYQWVRDGLNIPADQGGTARIFRTTTSGSYQVVVSNSGCTKTSVAVDVTAYPQPSATIEGEDQFDCVNSSGTNTFNVSGTFVGNTAVWSSNNPNFVVQDQVISTDPETGEMLATATVVATGSGNAIISLTASRAATVACQTAVATVGLTVRPLPDVTLTISGPTTFCQGEAVTLSVPDVEGAIYQWFRIFEGATTLVGGDPDFEASLPGNYYVVVTNNTCEATSATTALTINPLPTATIDPTGPVAVCAGGFVDLTAQTEAGATYRWLRETTTGVVEVGTPNTTFRATEAGRYILEVTGANECTNISPVTEVTVNPTPSAEITVIGNPALCQTSTVTLRAPATPAGQAYAYQWFVDGEVILADGNSRDYVASEEGDYTVQVTNTATTCSATTATPVTVTVSPLPSFTVVNPAAVCAPGTVDLTAAGIKTNASESLTYTYFRDAAAITVLSNPSAVATSGTYYIKGTSGAGCFVVQPVTVIINPRPTVTVNIPTTCAGTSTTVTANATGGVGPYTYTWTVPNNVTNPGNVASFPITVAGTYSVVVTDSRSCASASGSATYTPTAAPATPSITNITANQIIYTGERAANGSYSRTFTGSAPGTGNIGAFSGPGVSSSGVFNPCNALAAGQDSRDIVIRYTVTNTSTGCSSFVDVPVTVRRSTYTLVLQTAPFPVCQGVNTLYTARVLRDAVVTYPPTADIRTVPINIVDEGEDVSSLFTIQSGIGEGNNLPGNFNRDASFRNSSLSSEEFFISRAIPTGSFPTCASTATILSNRIYLGTPDVDITMRNPGSICPGTSVTFETTTTSASPGTLTYQWTVNGQPIDGATGATFTTSTLQNGDRVAVNFNVIGGTCGAATAKNTITMVVVVPQTVVSGSYCAGTTGFPISINSSQSGVGYQLVSVANNGSTSPVGNVIAGTGESISFGNQPAGTYSVIPIAASGAACARFNDATITETPLPNLFAVTGGGQYCAGGTGVIVGLDGSQVGITYRLMRGTTVVESVTRSTAGPFNFGNQTTAGNYTVTATTTASGTTVATCPRPMTGSATVVVNPLPTVTVNSPSVCAGTTATVTAVPSGGSGTYTTYTWTVPNGWTSPTGATNPGNVASFQTTTGGTFTVRVTDNRSCASSAVATSTVTINPLPTVTVNSPTVCAGTPATVTAVPNGGSGTYTTYTWTVPANATNPGNVASFTATVSGTYTVRVTDNRSCASSAAATSTVTINALPTAVTAMGGSYCAPLPGESATGATVTLGNTQMGVSYQLLNITTSPNQPVGSAVVSTEEGGSIVLGPVLAGTYNVVATRPATTCTATVFSSVTVTETPTVTPISEILIRNEAGAVIQASELQIGEEATFTAQTTFASGDIESFEWYTGDGTDANWTLVAEETGSVLTYTVPSGMFAVRLVIRAKAGTCYSTLVNDVATTPAVPLPVELIYLRTFKQGNNVLVEWATASEEGNAGFEVQVSENGLDFRKLDFVKTKNGNAMTKQVYQYVDKENGKHGTRYYRLKQIDESGTFEYFGVSVVNFGEVASLVKAFPNPFNTEVTLDIAAEQAGNVQVMMYNAAGRKMLERTIRVEKGFNTAVLEVSPDLPHGIYFVRVILNGQLYNLKLLKQ